MLICKEDNYLFTEIIGIYIDNDKMNIFSKVLENFIHANRITMIPDIKTFY